MKPLFFTLLLFSFFTVHSQVTASFDEIDLEEESFNNGSDGSGGFDSGNVFLPNNFIPDPMFPSWNGWSVSNTTDNTTPGFGNQYSAFPGAGFGGSGNYGLASAFFPVNMILQGEALGDVVQGLYVTNGTYPALSMLEGDGFAKKFGGEDGNDPDFFSLTIKGFSDGELSDESVVFYLADYRFENNDDDYIIGEWTYVDLTSLGAVDSLNFELNSSDVSMFGMNTPAYFMVDNIITAGTPVSTINQDLLNVTAYPNPVNDVLNISGDVPAGSQYQLVDAYGKFISNGKLFSPRVDMSTFQPGLYYLTIGETCLKVVKL